MEIEAILITHCHFDHIGAVAPVAKATGAPVYCPEIERPVLADIMSGRRRGSGRSRATRPSTRSRAASGWPRGAGHRGDVHAWPQPGHVTYVSRRRRASEASQASPLLSGDVLFQGSVGRVDLPGGDWATLERSIGALIETLPARDGRVSRHMGVTTLGREWDTNPFLSELRARDPLAAAARRAPRGARS